MEEVAESSDVAGEERSVEHVSAGEQERVGVEHTLQFAVRYQRSTEHTGVSLVFI